MAPHTSGLAVRRSVVDSCKWGPWQELTGVNLDPSLYRGAIQDFSLFVYICICSVLTFQTWMVPCISVNCYIVFGH